MCVIFLILRIWSQGWGDSSVSAYNFRNEMERRGTGVPRPVADQPLSFSLVRPYLKINKYINKRIRQSRKKMPEWACTPTFTNKYIQHTTYTSKKSNKISCIKIQIFMFYSTSWQYTHITILVIMPKLPAQEIPAYLSSHLRFQTFESDFFHHIHSSDHSDFFLYILYSSTLYIRVA